MNQNTNLVKLLIRYGADPNLKEYNDVGEKTPLHYAV
jgi:ankyrin repeat protein